MIPFAIFEHGNREDCRKVDAERIVSWKPIRVLNHRGGAEYESVDAVRVMLDSGQEFDSWETLKSFEVRLRIFRSKQPKK